MTETRVIYFYKEKGKHQGVLVMTFRDVKAMNKIIALLGNLYEVSQELKRQDGTMTYTMIEKQEGE